MNFLSKIYDSVFRGKNISLNETNKYINNQQKNNDNSEMVNSFYNIVTDFYEWGWGNSFHFFVNHKNNSFKENIVLYEHYVASKLNLKNGSKIVDMGCGIGGPMRTIARLTNCNVQGITINQYQVDKCSQLNKTRNITHLCNIVKGDFHNTQFDENSFDGGYAIESLCHSNDRSLFYKEICRILKPNTKFAIFTWVTTDQYNSENVNHNKIIKDIEYSNGLPPIPSYKTYLEELRNSDLEILENGDLEELAKAENNWYDPLVIYSYLIIRVLSYIPILISILFGFLNYDALKAQQILNVGATSLVKSGQLKIFTPLYYIIVKTPSRKQVNESESITESITESSIEPV